MIITIFFEAAKLQLFNFAVSIIALSFQLMKIVNPFRLFLVFSLMLAIFISPSCETDFDINDEWSDITIVYALLDPGEATTYLRINKAYLGGNVMEIAQIADSSSYHGQIDVKIDVYNPTELVQSIPFDTVTIGDKVPGVFYNPYQLVYKSDFNLGQFPDGYVFKLNIKNKISGKEVTAQTELVGNFIIQKPQSGSKAGFTSTNPKEFSWKSGKNGRRYEPMITFHYFEVPAQTYDTIEKVISYGLSIMTSQYLNGGEDLKTYYGSEFFTIVENNLDPTFEGTRLAGNVDFIVSAGADDFSTYMDVNGPSGSVVQDRPEFTNVVNGLGLFSSRRKVMRTLDLAKDSEQKLVDMDVKFIMTQGK